MVNKRNELYVCAVDSYTTRRSPHSTRVILKMSEYGMNLDEIDEYNDVSLFGAPYRIAEASNKDLCITDREETKLRVTVIDTRDDKIYIFRTKRDTVKTTILIHSDCVAIVTGICLCQTGVITVSIC